MLLMDEAIHGEGEVGAGVEVLEGGDRIKRVMQPGKVNRQGDVHMWHHNIRSLFRRRVKQHTPADFMEALD